MKRTASLCLLVVMLGSVGLTATAIVTVNDALAQVPPDAGAGSDAGPGSGSGSASPTPAKPSDSLDNPATNPAAAWDDAKAAKKLGWPALIFASVTMLAMAIGTIGRNLAWLAWLNKGRTATVLGAATALGAAGYNSAVEGGTVFAMLFAGVMAAAAFWNAHRAPTPTEASKA